MWSILGTYPLKFSYLLPALYKPDWLFLMISFLMVWKAWWGVDENLCTL
jgi:hypothetical protein